MPDVAEVPLHWGVSGEIDRWGSPDELTGVFWFLGAVMSGANLMMALCFMFNDRLYSAGLVTGVSRQGALKVYVVLAIVLAVMVIGIVFGILSKVNSVL